MIVPTLSMTTDYTNALNVALNSHNNHSCPTGYTGRKEEVMRKLINLVMYYYNCRRYGKIVAYSMFKMNGRVVKKPIERR